LAAISHTQQYRPGIKFTTCTYSNDNNDVIQIKTQSLSSALGQSVCLAEIFSSVFFANNLKENIGSNCEGAENAGRENDGREIDGPICRA